MDQDKTAAAEPPSQPQRTQVFVVRHGETVWNAAGRQQGQLDTALSELGAAQAAAIAERLSAAGIDVLYSSDLGRALQTAQIIAQRLGLDVRLEERLRERHLGMLQGLTMEEFRQRHGAEYALFHGGDPDWALPGGESIRQRHDRAVAGACDVAGRHPGQTVAIVTHGGVLESLMRHTLGLGLDVPRRFSLFNASINTFGVAAGQWKLERWGITDHLRGLGTKDDW